LDLPERRRVKVTDPCRIDEIEHRWRWIGLDGVERVAWKGVQKPLRRDGEPLRKKDVDRINRFQPLDDFLDAGEFRNRRFKQRGSVHPGGSIRKRDCLGQSMRRVKKESDARQRVARSSRMVFLPSTLG